MKTNYNIKNFRVFGIEGAEARIAPLTILTGCNSSGKSSIAKSILLLDNFLQKVKTALKRKDELELGKYTMDFTDYPLNLLGRFDKVVNSSSASGEIEYRFTASNNLEVVLVFATNSADVLNRGYLKSLVILKEGITIFCTQNGTCKLNVIPFWDEYLEYTRKREYPDFFNPYGYEKEHKISKEAVKWAIDNGSPFKVSILDKIGTLDNSNFQTAMDEMLAPVYEDVPGVRVFIHRLSEVFVESDCASFSEFFSLREKEWMSGISWNDSDSQVLSWRSVASVCTIFDSSWRDLMKRLVAGDKFSKRLTEEFRKAWIGFPILLTTLTNVGEMIGLKQDNLFSERINFSTWYEELIEYAPNYTIYYLWDGFMKFVNKQIQEAFIPSWCGSLSYVGSSRIDVKRLYTLDAKTDFSALLNRYFSARRDFVGLKENEKEKGYEPDAFMNKWLKNFGICDYVTLDLDSEGLGVLIKLHKGDKTSLLADEGYGITQLFSLLMEIETGIQSAFHRFLGGNFGYNYRYEIDEDGKVLFPEQTIIIEEPEIHLHPRYQSLLVDMFAEAREKYNIHFIIETHSEYLIRRLQLRVAEKKISTDDVSVIYVDQNSHPYNMELSDNGKFSQEFGTGFLDEADNAAIQLFDLTNE